jgi:hypothetical protein
MSSTECRSKGRKERDQKAQEAASLDTIGKLSQKCLGTHCVYSIEERDGCEHMTCKFKDISNSRSER